MKKILLLIIFSSFLFSSSIADLKIGEELYQNTCISCHGIDGKANTDIKLIVKPRDLTLTLLDEEQTYQIIKEGARYWGAKSDMMPSFKYVLNEQQLRAVTAYITQNFNPNVQKRIEDLLSSSEIEPIGKDKKMAKWGNKIFKKNCIYCHGAKGKGDGIATKSPVDSIFPYDLTKAILTKDQMFLYIKYGGKYFGTEKNDMPNWNKKYNDFKLHSITKYIDEIIRKKNENR